MGFALTILFDFLTAAGAIATGIAAWIASGQLRESREQARTQFEDAMSREYRDLIQAIPTKALLGDELTDAEFAKAFDELYRYVDLSNEQTFLRQKGRVSKEAWENWSSGMASNFERPAFRDAWDKIKERASEDFAELRWLEATGFKGDPAVSPVVAPAPSDRSADRP